MKKYLLLMASAMCFVAVQAQNCNSIYVSPTGSGLTGTKGSPTSLLEAFTIYGVDNSRDFIYLEEGIYTITETVNVPAGITIDGGYVLMSGEWIKSSSAITSLNINPSVDVIDVSGIDVGAYVGFALNNVSNVSLKDLNINVLSSGTTNQTNNRGESIYGVHINNAGDYSFNRINITTGNASNGLNGIDGANGADGLDGDDGKDGANNSGDTGKGHGGNGGNAFDMATTLNGGAGGAGADNATNRNGKNGDSGVNYRAGGAGGGGGAGGFGQVGGFATPWGTAGYVGGVGGANGAGTLTGPSAGTGGGVGCNGGAGANGGVGLDATIVDGLDYPIGDRPSDVSYSAYFVPGAQAESGGNGQGGSGGSGGGGGGPDAPTFTCWSISGAGNGAGAGGGGGEGGEGGTGGYGGGSTFGVYATGTNAGFLYNVNSIPGNLGNGGAGGAKGTGGIGGIGGAGATKDGGDVGIGGNGGDGGNGVDGGRGRDGANGVSLDFYNVVPESATIITSNITAQYYEGCTNSRIDISKSTGNWNLSGSDGAFVNDLSPFTTSFDSQSAAAQIFFTTIGNKDIAIESENFKEFISIRYTRDLPVLDGVSNTCINTAVDFSTVEVADEFNIVIYDAFGAIVDQSNTNSLSATFTAAGTYYAKLEVKTGCCGWSMPVWQVVNVSQPMTYTVDQSLCQGDSVMLEGAYQTAAGTYTDTHTGMNGCDSIIETTLALVNLTVDMNDFAFDSICTTSNAIPLPLATPAGGVYSGAGVDGTTFDPSIVTEGNQDVTYTYVDGNGCEGTEVSSIEVVDCAGPNVGIEDVDFINADIYPNPTTGILNIQLSTSEPVTVEIYNIQGRLILSEQITSEGTLDINSFDKGTYLLRIGALVKTVIKQ